MADSDAARIGDVKNGLAAAKDDTNTRLKKDGSNVEMSSSQAADFRAAIGAEAAGGSSGGNVVGPETVELQRLPAFSGTNGRQLLQGPLFGSLGPLSLMYRAQCEAEFQAKDTGLSALAGLTTPGLYYLSAVDTWSAVTIGSNLTFTGGVLSASGGGGGDVTGPSSATDGRMAVFSGSTGKLLKEGLPVGGAAVNEVLIRGVADDLYIAASARGANNGVASLGSGGKVPAEQLAVATTSADGMMTSADKTKLNSVASGATANATNAQLRDRSTHTGTQAWGTLTDTPAITGLSASTSSLGNTVAQRDSNGYLFANRVQTIQGFVYFMTGGSNFIRFATDAFSFSHAATGPAFTPTSDPRLKTGMVRQDDDGLSLERVCGIYQWTYTRKQDGVFAAGGNAFDLREINPLFVVGGETIAVEEEARDRGALQKGDGTWETPLAVDLLAIVTEQAGAIRELRRRLVLLEAQTAEEPLA